MFSVLNARKIIGQKIRLSSYTCVVVPQEIVASGNSPDFFEPQLDGLASEIQHGAADYEILTHIFGREIDISRVQSNSKFIIEDSCLSWSPGQDKIRGDAVLYSLNISKPLSTIWGGILGTNDWALHQEILLHRRKLIKKPLLHEFRVAFSLLFSCIIYNKITYTLAHYLKGVCPLSNKPTYSLKNFTRPKNFNWPLSKLQCAVALRQLNRFHETQEKRRIIAAHYFEQLNDVPSIKLPHSGNFDNPTHFIIRHKKANNLRVELYKRGINTGNPIDYTCALLDMFKSDLSCAFDRTDSLSRETIALPFYTQLRRADVIKITSAIKSICTNPEFNE